MDLIACYMLFEKRDRGVSSGKFVVFVAPAPANIFPAGQALTPAPETIAPRPNTPAGFESGRWRGAGSPAFRPPTLCFLMYH